MSHLGVKSYNKSWMAYNGAVTQIIQYGLANVHYIKSVDNQVDERNSTGKIEEKNILLAQKQQHLPFFIFQRHRHVYS